MAYVAPEQDFLDRATARNHPSLQYLRSPAFQFFQLLTHDVSTAEYPRSILWILREVTSGTRSFTRLVILIRRRFVGLPKFSEHPHERAIRISATIGTLRLAQVGSPEPGYPPILSVRCDPFEEYRISGFGTAAQRPSV